LDCAPYCGGGGVSDGTLNGQSLLSAATAPSSNMADAALSIEGIGTESSRLGEGRGGGPIESVDPRRDETSILIRGKRYDITIMKV